MAEPMTLKQRMELAERAEVITDRFISDLVERGEARHALTPHEVALLYKFCEGVDDDIAALEEHGYDPDDDDDDADDDE